MSDKSQVKVYLPKELHELLNADQRNNSEVVESALWREFGGKRKAVAEVQLEQKEKQLGAVRSEKDELETEESRLSQQVTALRERVNGLEDTEKELDTDLDELLTHLEDSGQHVWPNAENVRDLATARKTSSYNSKSGRPKRGGTSITRNSSGRIWSRTSRRAPSGR